MEALLGVQGRAVLGAAVYVCMPPCGFVTERTAELLLRELGIPHVNLICGFASWRGLDRAVVSSE